MISEQQFELIKDGLKLKGRQTRIHGKRIDILFEDRFGKLGSSLHASQCKQNENCGNPTPESPYNNHNVLALIRDAKK